MGFYDFTWPLAYITLACLSTTAQPSRAPSRAEIRHLKAAFLQESCYIIGKSETVLATWHCVTLLWYKRAREVHGTAREVQESARAARQGGEGEHSLKVWELQGGVCWQWEDRIQVSVGGVVGGAGPSEL